MVKSLFIHPLRLIPAISLWIFRFIAIEELPEELMMLILSKLPVKSLLRFKCVHKSWYSLINSPQFVHLHSTSSTSHDCCIVRRFVEQKQQNVLSLHSYETLEDLGNQINLPIPDRFGAGLCGSCDGLVCVSNYVDQILICNPTIRELRSLFVPPTLSKRSDYIIDSVAFGFDPNTGKYTVLMIGVPKDYDDFHVANYGDREARLYDFSTDSWREPAMAFPPGPFRYSRCAVSLNGAFHWCPWDGDSNILTFHMSNEVTELLPVPDFSVDVCYQKQLCVSSKSQLSLILYDLRGWFEICVMIEYGVQESWARLFKIGPLLPYVIDPMVFWDEQRLFLRTAEAQLVSCDLQHQNLCHFPIHGGFDVYPFCQSLVSVNMIGESFT